jgi:hypothetical protein
MTCETGRYTVVYAGQWVVMLQLVPFTARAQKLTTGATVAQTTDTWRRRAVGGDLTVTVRGQSENVSGFDNSATSQPTSAHMGAILAHTARF